MGRKSGLRAVNSSRWAKHTAVLITKELEAVAEGTGVNVRRVVADKMKESYKRNLELSYTPRSVKGWETMLHNDDPYTTHKRKLTYKHTNTLRDEGVDVVIDGNWVKVVIKDVPYKDGTSTVQVYEWLTKGTRSTGANYAYKNKDGSISGGRNYPTEIHHFEEWTRVDMQGFLETLKGDIHNNVYTSYRYTGKKKKRTHYKGVDIREGEL